MYKKGLLLFVGVIVCAMGTSFVIKGAIGASAWDALSQSISGVTSLKIGTVSMIINISCVVAQLIIVRPKSLIMYILQIAIAVVFGSVLNFFLYQVLGQIEVTNLIVRTIAVVMGTIIAAFAVSFVMSLDFVGFPLESLCKVLSKNSKLGFGKIRQLADVISMAIVVVITFALGNELTLGVGTVIGVVLFGPLIDLFTSSIHPRIHKTLNITVN